MGRGLRPAVEWGSRRHRERQGSSGHLESLDSRSRHWDLVPQAMSSSLGCCELESQVLVRGRLLPTLVGWISLGGGRSCSHLPRSGRSFPAARHPCGSTSPGLDGHG